jgi:G3E family GTPase
VEDDLPRVRLDRVICIVDGWASTRYPQVGYVGRMQLRQADIILINKADLITPGQIDEITEQIRNYNKTAVVIATEHCTGVESLIFTEHGVREKSPAITAPLHSANLESFTFTSDRRLNEACFTKWADELPSEIFRAKGFVMLDSGDFLFNSVAGRWELEAFNVESNQLVFIGRNFSFRQTVLNNLRQCER